MVDMELQRVESRLPEVFQDCKCNFNCSRDQYGRVRDYLVQIREPECKDKMRKELGAYLNEQDISLSDLICDKKNPGQKTSLFSTMIAEPNGHLIISRVLDSIVEMPSEEEVRIKLGSGLLYREEGEHKTRILEELVHLRARYKGRPGQRAVQGVLAHPVMEALIREKWHTVNYHLRDHIG